MGQGNIVRATGQGTDLPIIHPESTPSPEEFAAACVHGESMAEVCMMAGRLTVTQVVRKHVEYRLQRVNLPALPTL